MLESMGKEFKSVRELENNYEKIQSDAYQRANILKKHGRACKIHLQAFLICVGADRIRDIALAKRSCR